MRFSLKLPAFIALVTGTALLSLLHACRDTPEPTAPNFATAVLQTLTVKGTGTGSGVVKSSPAGINCTITAGVAGTTGCTARFTQGTVVTLTATPNSGHSFRAWSGSCTGKGTCRVTMSVNRTVTARFLKGPFTIKISGGSATGSGTVTSQPGLSPAINCVITNGVPAATGCSVKYPAYTRVVLTGTPAGGSTFTGWGSPCSGTGTCQYTAIQAITIPARFAVSGGGPGSTQGRWETSIKSPVVAIHMHVLPTGKVLLWGHAGEAYTWDPANPGGAFTPVALPYEVFCAGHTFLADGRLFLAGGHIANYYGLPAATIYDPSTGSWSGAVPPMAQGRWYPTTTALPDGNVLVTSGSDENAVMVTVPELWNGSSWRRLTGVSLSQPYYPETFVAPNGKPFFAGRTSGYIDVGGNGAWTPVANMIVSDRNSGSAAMYAPGKILFAGGGKVPTSSAEVIDLNSPTPGWRSVASMTYRRRHLLTTLLADGKVLVTHGTSGSANDQTLAVYFPELWDPVSESWSIMAREPTLRTYHSTAMLLPDGRVLSGGSGEGAGVSYANSQFSIQVFTPPYLFAGDGSLASRPTITSAPARISYGQPFSVETPNAGTVSRGTLVRLSSVTHSYNQSQHLYPLTFSAEEGSATRLTASAPPNPGLAPPGPYMLFLLNSAGVPSVAAMVTVGP